MPSIYSGRTSILRSVVSPSLKHRPLLAHRSLHQSPQRLATDVTSVAVLGGGITGLVATYYLSKWLPQSTHIELFESSSRLGGWIGSTKVDVGAGEVVFENGPRSLRPAGVSGLVTLDLVGGKSLIFHLPLFLVLFWCPCSSNRMSAVLSIRSMSDSTVFFDR